MIHFACLQSAEGWLAGLVLALVIVATGPQSEGWAGERVGMEVVVAPEEIPSLIKYLESPDPITRELAIGQIARVKPEDAVRPFIPALIVTLKDENPVVRSSTALLLGRLRASDALEGLRVALHDQNNTVRRHAAYALGEVGKLAAPAVPNLLELLEASDPRLRSTGAASLGKIGQGTSQAVEIMIKDLTLPDKYDRFEAARSLGIIGPSAGAAVPALRALLTDINCVAAGAAIALEQIGTPEALSALQTYDRPIGTIPQCE